MPLQVNTPIFQSGSRIAVLGVCCMVTLASVGAAAGDAAKPGAQLSLSLDGGRLSLAARDVPLETVLRAVAIEGGFALKVQRKLRGTYSGSFQNLSLHAAVLRLLRNANAFVIEFGPSGAMSNTRRLRRLTVIGEAIAQDGRSTTMQSNGEMLGGASTARASVARREKIDKIRKLSLDRSPAAAETLSGLLLNDRDGFIRGAAANVLARFRGEGVEAALISALDDRDVSVRRRAIVALGQVRAKGAVNRLIKILRTEWDEESAVLAAKALRGHYSPEILDALAEVSDDPNERIRNAAQSALTRLKRTH